eukprot:TRINITY_DN13123_c0_g1_i3.p1 TRINITY_DN13123_c0_g1~~TRINITY_DN13123_c0_g1_i3.p1  ORF type:complete len:189 (+),score=38.81 TRINITY_DN13123_c0_g1_i3:52-618(+)
MLQGGGGNNQSAALLREVFAQECKHRLHHECSWRRQEQRFARELAAKEPKDLEPVPPSPPRQLFSAAIVAAAGSGRAAACTLADGSPRQLRPRRPGLLGGRPWKGGKLARYRPGATSYRNVEESHKGYGWGVQPARSFQPPVEPREPVHGMKPPFLRRTVTKAFNDDLSGGIACLCPPVRDRQPHKQQ